MPRTAEEGAGLRAKVSWLLFRASMLPEIARMLGSMAWATLVDERKPHRKAWRD